MNKHTYRESYTTTINLPPGRFLEQEDIVQIGDMCLWPDMPPGTVTNLYQYLGYMVRYVPIKELCFYRPEPKKAKSKPKYRTLKVGEVILKDDQIYLNHKWEKVGFSFIGWIIPKDTIYKRRRRLHVKTS